MPPGDAVEFDAVPGRGSAPCGGVRLLRRIGGRFASCLYEARADEPVHLVTRTAVNLQNLSYWPGTDQLWMVNEYGGERIVANVPWPGASPMPAGIVKTTSADFTGDGRADLVTVEAATGKLWLYPGTGALNGTGTLGVRTRIGTGWDSMRQLVGADFNGDGAGDVDAVQAPAGATGPLYFYPGTG
ncbi:VCBS repeat-containing protein, partial [Streptomyces sp. NPDC052196]|uniref:FG-GAP repeat domain-containing protein n=1 Tax=Streptomyces sp. NPDC052196 TaxID=3156691 RepID=UPI00343DC041